MIMYDSGKEFAGHKSVDQSLDSTAYFADVYASWQRGSNINYSGFLSNIFLKSVTFLLLLLQSLKWLRIFRISTPEKDWHLKPYISRFMKL